MLQRQVPVAALHAGTAPLKQVGTGLGLPFQVQALRRTQRAPHARRRAGPCKDLLGEFPQPVAFARGLCLLGGAVGILFGRLASILVRWIMRWPTQTSMPAIIAAVAVSATVGVVFGFYPAWKASRLDPIEALRYE